MKKVSVIIPLYNEEKYITTCVESVINQTYKNIEIIVVDDKSTDNSLKVLEKIKDKRLKIIKLPENKGVANARNKGVEAATGSYLCFLDSDDFWDKYKIEKQIKYIKNKAFVYSKYAYTDKDGNIIKVANVAKKLSYQEALKNTCIFTSTVMFDLTKIKSIPYIIAKTAELIDLLLLENTLDIDYVLSYINVLGEKNIYNYQHCI